MKKAGKKANKKQIKKGRVRSMKNITTKQFQLLSDNQIVWDLLAGSYAENGVAAPFFEYAITSTWFDKRYLYLDRLWFDGDKAVGFVFYEAPCTDGSQIYMTERFTMLVWRKRAGMKADMQTIIGAR